VKGDTLGDVIRRIGRSVNLQSDLTLTDAQLLERFVKQRDEPAFAALLVRHGPMVLGVCRQLVRDAQEAEDAFQATFLVLARKAAVIRRQPLLASWLYGVAYRVAIRLRGQTARRRTREQRDVDLTTLAAADDCAYSDVRPLVHEEVGRLPDKYRSAVILCYLEGKTNEEAALQLRWPVGSVKSRLARARDLLRTRLTRRGLTLSAGLLTTELVLNKASASPTLVDATIRGAALFAAGDAVAGGLISARAVALSYGVLRTMILTKAKILAVLALTVVMLGGAGGLAYRSPAAEPGDTPKAAPMKTASHDADRTKTNKEKPVDKPMDDREAIQGTWQRIDWSAGVKVVPYQDHSSESITWVIEADNIRAVKDMKKKLASFSYKLDPTKKPKEIDMVHLDGPENVKGKLVHGAYTLEGDILKICNRINPGDARPTEVATNKLGEKILQTFKRKAADEDKPKDEYAWGMAAKGIQAGLCIRPGEKNSYAVGETAMFVVKVRNVSDKPAEFRYVVGNGAELVSPSVLDADDNRVNLSGPIHIGNGGRGYGEKALGVGEEVEFAISTLVMAPVAESGVTEKLMAHVKPGKYKVSYYVNYVNPDDTENYLTTGQVEIVVTAAK
jgi:RNA polymerase sigma factor (sigma-70 family)